MTNPRPHHRYGRRYIPICANDPEYGALNGVYGAFFSTFLSLMALDRYIVPPSSGNFALILNSSTIAGAAFGFIAASNLHRVVQKCHVYTYRLTSRQTNILYRNAQIACVAVGIFAGAGIGFSIASCFQQSYAQITQRKAQDEALLLPAQVKLVDKMNSEPRRFSGKNRPWIGQGKNSSLLQ